MFMAMELLEGVDLREGIRAKTLGTSDADRRHGAALRRVRPSPTQRRRPPRPEARNIHILPSGHSRSSTSALPDCSTSEMTQTGWSWGHRTTCPPSSSRARRPTRAPRLRAGRGLLRAAERRPRLRGAGHARGPAAHTGPRSGAGATPGARHSRGPRGARRPRSGPEPGGSAPRTRPRWAVGAASRPRRARGRNPGRPRGARGSGRAHAAPGGRRDDRRAAAATAERRGHERPRHGPATPRDVPNRAPRHHGCLRPADRGRTAQPPARRGCRGPGACSRGG